MIRLASKSKFGIGVILLLFYSGVCYAQKGKDGTKIISSSNTVVNEYTSLTVDANPGATSITVSNSRLNANNRFSGPLGSGDLIMIIQMQGATINGVPDDSTWGAITNYNNCGLYEFLQVKEAPDTNTINIECSLNNNYTASGKVQIIRMPRYTSLTVNTGGSAVAADLWNGMVGGVIAFEVQDSTIINTGGSIDASGAGFRGGKLNNVNGGANMNFDFASVDISMGGEKGESIAGYESDYTVYQGMYQRGAPANGGGGGNTWNSGGGGGANAGDINKWTGNGNPDTTTNATWIIAWNLEYNGFANATSSGGGRGGYSVGFKGPNPLTTGPDNPAWTTYSRCNTGGKGGRPLDYSTGRLFFGGGGGASQEDNFHGSAGANGGGIVYLLSYGIVTGGGIISSNGDVATNANCGTGAGDPPGGGGGGGTVIINSTDTIIGIAVNANGGKGGDQVIGLTGESEGPGGGGGGGYIAISKGSPKRLASGGINGITNADFMSTFPPNGATGAGNGIPDASISPVVFSSHITINSPTICLGQSVQLNAEGGDVGDVYSWTPSTGLDSADVSDPWASPVNTTKYIVIVSNGNCTGKDSALVTVLPKVVITHEVTDSICSARSVALNAGGSSGYTYTWKPSAGLSCSTCNNPTANPSATTTYTVIATNQYCSDTGVQVVKVLPLPALLINDTTICYGQLTQLNATTNGKLTWLPGIYLSCTSCNNPQITPLSDTTYTITATLDGCTTRDTFKVITDRPNVFAGTDTTIYNNSTATLHGSGLLNLTWSPPGNLSASNVADPVASPSVSTTYTLLGIDSFGCSATSSVVVFVKSPCANPVLPNAFSPNNDGNNEVYRIINPFIDKLVSFRIYNRWGQLVFETTDLNTGWDGKFNGKPEQVGTYVYYLDIICLGANQSYKGNVTLLR